MNSRETAAEALFKALTASSAYLTTGRRNRAPESYDPDQTPALMLLDSHESYDRPAANLPPKRTLHFKAIIYHDAGDDQNVVPSTIINNLLDGVDVALTPDCARDGRCTLGGTAYSVAISGEVEKAPGDISGKSLAVVPISVVLP